MQQMTWALAMAAGKDAANRSMRQGKRKAWSVGDYRKGCQEMERLMKLVDWAEPVEPETPT